MRLTQTNDTKQTFIFVATQTHFYALAFALSAHTVLDYEHILILQHVSATSTQR
jgi:hypothetical protein